MNAIEILDLKKVYDKKVVIDNVTLNIERNQIFGFLGRNGAGKSTLINILSGNVNKTSGQFKILDYPDEKINDIKNVIGVMPDISNLYGNMNAFQFLKYMANLKKVNIKKDEIYNILKDVGLENVERVKINNYSFGMKKKISLGQAIIGNPKVLFLDEPTSGVDPDSILLIQNLMKKLRDKGSTIFLTSHNLNEIEKLCTNIAILKEGKIKIQGNLEEIKNSFNNSLKVTINYRWIDELTKMNYIKGIKIIQDKGNEIEYELESISLIPQLVNHLANNGVEIYSVNSRKPSLEDIFFS